MRLIWKFALAGTVALWAGSALAADDPIAARQALMKANNGALRSAFGMASGRAPYDAAKAASDMQKIADDMKEFVTLFPEGSDKGDTGALPEIWTNMDDFKAIAEKLASDATAAAAAAPDGAAAFGAALNAVGGNCKACHDKYKAPS